MTHSHDRYVNMMKWWIADHSLSPQPESTVNTTSGIPAPRLTVGQPQNFNKTVSEHYRQMLGKLASSMEKQIESLADSGDVDDHLTDHVKHVIDLATYLPGSEIQRVLPSLCTNSEVEEGLTANELKDRCAAALKVSVDQLDRHDKAFKTEIKRRLKAILEDKLKAKGSKEFWATALKSPESQKNALFEEILDFIMKRDDQGDENWRKIAHSEAKRIVDPSGGRPRYMMM